MRGPQRDPNIQDKIRAWVKKNPDRWYTARYEDIHVESGVSLASLHRYFTLIVARAANELPSEVKEKRQAHHGVSPWQRKLDADEIAEIERLFAEDNTALDISFITGRSLSQIEKYNPKKKKED